MAYFGRRSDQKYSGRKRKPYNKDTGGLQTGGSVANRMSQAKDNFQDYEFYEIELRLWWFMIILKNYPSTRMEPKLGIWEESRQCHKKIAHRHLKIYLPFVGINPCPTSW